MDTPTPAQQTGVPLEHPATAAAAAEVAALQDEPTIEGDLLERPGFPSLAGNLAAVVIPFLALIAASILFWDTRFSWLNLGMLLGGYFLTAVGITVGYHRLFTHKSFKTNAVVTAVLGVLGSMAVEGPILTWVATHRRHHQFSDRPDDPHSPHHHGDEHGGGIGSWFRGMIHAHFGWLFAPAPSEDVMAKYVPDLRADRLTSSLSKLFGVWAVLGLVLPAAIGLAATGTWIGALMGFIWGGLLRVFLVHHVTWSVNSICHVWGAQPFNTHDYSRNNPIFGILALGEGWHNTHHAFPTSARHGLEWWQVDVSYLVIRLLALFGLAWDIKIPSPERIAAKRRQRPMEPIRARAA